MELLICTGCGTFVLAARRAGSLVPIGEDCPECGGSTFEDVAPDGG